MGKIFVLSIFVDFFIIGIALGKSQRKIGLLVAAQILLLLTVIYICMGLYISTQPDFLVPKAG